MPGRYQSVVAIEFRGARRRVQKLQRIPQNVASIGLEQPVRKTADPDLQRFVGVGCGLPSFRIAPETDALSSRSCGSRSSHRTSTKPKRWSTLSTTYKLVQRFPENATAISRQRPAREKADPVFPESAAMGFDLSESLNLRVEGSIPSWLTNFLTKQPTAGLSCSLKP